MFPVTVTIPIWPTSSVNQRLPSGPATIFCGEESAVGMGYCVTEPLGVILPTWLEFNAVNHMLPSGPRAM